LIKRRNEKKVGPMMDAFRWGGEEEEEEEGFDGRVT